MAFAVGACRSLGSDDADVARRSFRRKSSRTGWRAGASKSLGLDRTAICDFETHAGWGARTPGEEGIHDRYSAFGLSGLPETLVVGTRRVKQKRAIFGGMGVASSGRSGDAASEK
jgi:hypothetical protein